MPVLAAAPDSASDFLPAGQLQLPTEVLARVILTAADASEPHSVMPAGLLTLARCSLVSRSFRLAAEAAAETVTSVNLGCRWDRPVLPPSAVTSSLFSLWARQWERMILNLNAPVITGPQFAGFIHDSCTALCDLRLYGSHDEPQSQEALVGIAYLEAAAAAVGPLQLEMLTCDSFTPSRGVPDGVTSLVINGLWTAPNLELLLLRCSSPTSSLQELSLLCVRGSCISLRSTVLSGLHLPQLEHLNMVLEAGADTLELSWLARPRNFVLMLSLESDLRFSGQEWVRLLQELRRQRALKPQDVLKVNTGAHQLPVAGFEVLCTMQLERISLTLPPQVVVQLPAVPEVHLSFSTWDMEDEAAVQGLSGMH